MRYPNGGCPMNLVNRRANAARESPATAASSDEREQALELFRARRAYGNVRHSGEAVANRKIMSWDAVGTTSYAPGCGTTRRTGPLPMPTPTSHAPCETWSSEIAAAIPDQHPPLSRWRWLRHELDNGDSAPPDLVVSTSS